MVLTTTWDDTWGEQEKTYVVQTSSKVIQRCLLMTTDPGDLVLDPTCVRKGTQVWVASVDDPTLALPVDGEGTEHPPVDGEGTKHPPVHGGTEGGLTTDVRPKEVHAGVEESGREHVA